MEANRAQSPGSDEATSPTNAKKRLLSYEENMQASSNMIDDKVSFFVLFFLIF